MWHFISDQISQQLGIDFICDDIREISDGDSHKSFKISDGKRRFFVKINEIDKLVNFEAECIGLEHLQKTEILKVPKIICLGAASDKSFLVLEFITMQSGSKEAWFKFGQKLAQQHQSHTQNMYGWQEDNFIGLSPQPNNWQKKWSEFFAEQRIGFMLQLLAEKGHNLADIDKVVDSVKQLFAGHNPVSSMLHGDLWQGNIGFHNDEPVIFDPAFYFGDREAEIAMTELFNRFPAEFYHGYDEVWPLDVDYQYRKPVYQLYHILNHALIFGGQYLNSAKSNLNMLAA